MYRYNEFDQQFVQERVDHYREQTARYLAGEISDDAFQQLRLRNGLYIPVSYTHLTLTTSDLV